VIVILVPGFTASIDTLHFLRNRLEAEGHIVYGPGFNWNTMLNGELKRLAEKIDEIGHPVVLIGHSAGGLLSVLSAQAKHPLVDGVIGLGSAIVGKVSVDVPYYEARSLWGLLFPIDGPDEVKVFPVGHAMLPFMPCVQDWVIEKLEAIDDRQQLPEVQRPVTARCVG